MNQFAAYMLAWLIVDSAKGDQHRHVMSAAEIAAFNASQIAGQAAVMPFFWACGIIDFLVLGWMAFYWVYYRRKYGKRITDA